MYGSKFSLDQLILVYSFLGNSRVELIQVWIYVTLKYDLIDEECLLMKNMEQQMKLLIAELVHHQTIENHSISLLIKTYLLSYKSFVYIDTRCTARH